jgi:hypothetical protein
MSDQIDPNSIAYIFERNKMFKVCDHATAQLMWDELIIDGYTHVSTVDWATYLQWILNECPSLGEERESLLTKPISATNETNRI